MTPTITFLSDYGLGDECVGLVQGGLEGAGLRRGERDAASSLGGDASHVALVGRTVADVGVGGFVFYEDAGGLLALAVNGGSAAKRLAVGLGDRVVIAPE